MDNRLVVGLTAALWVAIFYIIQRFSKSKTVFIATSVLVGAVFLGIVYLTMGTTNLSIVAAIVIVTIFGEVSRKHQNDPKPPSQDRSDNRDE